MLRSSSCAPLSSGICESSCPLQRSCLTDITCWGRYPKNSNRRWRRVRCSPRGLRPTASACWQICCSSAPIRQIQTCSATTTCTSNTNSCPQAPAATRACTGSSARTHCLHPPSSPTSAQIREGRKVRKIVRARVREGVRKVREGPRVRSTPQGALQMQTPALFQNQPRSASRRPALTPRARSRPSWVCRARASSRAISRIISSGAGCCSAWARSSTRSSTWLHATSLSLRPRPWRPNSKSLWTLWHVKYLRVHTCRTTVSRL
mmetsp:Transcript_950/g.2540  ORF Transcript_950/g.2540 Transcript_950/m.2540 type:complete len:263 (+) Transcript_950:594-1382(+)